MLTIFSSERTTVGFLCQRTRAGYDTRACMGHFHRSTLSRLEASRIVKGSAPAPTVAGMLGANSVTWFPRKQRNTPRTFKVQGFQRQDVLLGVLRAPARG